MIDTAGGIWYNLNCHRSTGSSFLKTATVPHNRIMRGELLRFSNLSPVARDNALDRSNSFKGAGMKKVAKKIQHRKPDAWYRQQIYLLDRLIDLIRADRFGYSRKR